MGVLRKYVDFEELAKGSLKPREDPATETSHSTNHPQNLKRAHVNTEDASRRRRKVGPDSTSEASSPSLDGCPSDGDKILAPSSTSEQTLQTDQNSATRRASLTFIVSQSQSQDTSEPPSEGLGIQTLLFYLDSTN